MARRLSRQAGLVLVTLARDPATWRHGYDLYLELGLKPGTLYPILMRLSERGLLEAVWESDPPVGRPRRHLYRILGAGERAVAELVPRPGAWRVGEPRSAW